jgi:hypothetical protein
MGSNVKESAERVAAQVARPAALLMDGVQDVAQLSFGKQNSTASFKATASEANFRSIHFAAVEDVVYTEVTGNLFISLRRQSMQRNDPVQLEFHKLSKEVAREIVEGLKNARQRSVADWHYLRRALRKEQLLAAAMRSTAEETGGAGERILEVFEVERYHKLSRSWRTPFNLLLDNQTTWRWLDAKGNRHSQLIPMTDKRFSKCSNKEYYKQKIQEPQKYPPCELDSMFVLRRDWEIEVNAKTDEMGWRYANAFNASTWDSRAHFSDEVRKRRWTRIYE